MTRDRSRSEITPGDEFFNWNRKLPNGANAKVTAKHPNDKWTISVNASLHQFIYVRDGDKIRNHEKELLNNLSAEFNKDLKEKKKGKYI